MTACFAAGVKKTELFCLVLVMSSDSPVPISEVAPALLYDKGLLSVQFRQLSNRAVFFRPFVSRKQMPTGSFVEQVLTVLLNGEMHLFDEDSKPKWNAPLARVTTYAIDGPIISMKLTEQSGSITDVILRFDPGPRAAPSTAPGPGSSGPAETVSSPRPSASSPLRPRSRSVTIVDPREDYSALLATTQQFIDIVRYFSPSSKQRRESRDVIPQSNDQTPRAATTRAQPAQGPTGEPPQMNSLVGGGGRTEDTRPRMHRPPPFPELDHPRHVPAPLHQPAPQQSAPHLSSMRFFEFALRSMEAHPAMARATAESRRETIKSSYVDPNDPLTPSVARSANDMITQLRMKKAALQQQCTLLRGEVMGLETAVAHAERYRGPLQNAETFVLYPSATSTRGTPIPRAPPQRTATVAFTRTAHLAELILTICRRRRQVVLQALRDEQALRQRRALEEAYFASAGLPPRPFAAFPTANGYYLP